MSITTSALQIDCSECASSWTVLFFDLHWFYNFAVRYRRRVEAKSSILMCARCRWEIHLFVSLDFFQFVCHSECSLSLLILLIYWEDDKIRKGWRERNERCAYCSTNINPESQSPRFFDNLLAFNLPNWMELVRLHFSHFNSSIFGTDMHSASFSQSADVCSSINAFGRNRCLSHRFDCKWMFDWTASICLIYSTIWSAHGPHISRLTCVNKTFNRFLFLIV